MSDLHLSDIYNGIKLWALVYHTQPSSAEVELITNRFFKSKKKAMRWFNRKRVPSAYIEPEVVEVYGFASSSGLGGVALGSHYPVPTNL